MQETFLKIWNSFDTFDASQGELYTWMNNIARNLAIYKSGSTEFQNQTKNTSVENHVSRIDMGLNNELHNEPRESLKEEPLRNIKLNNIGT